MIQEALIDLALSICVFNYEKLDRVWLLLLLQVPLISYFSTSLINLNVRNCFGRRVVNIYNKFTKQLNYIFLQDKLVFIKLIARKCIYHIADKYCFIFQLCCLLNS